MHIFPYKASQSVPDMATRGVAAASSASATGMTLTGFGGVRCDRNFARTRGVVLVSRGQNIRLLFLLHLLLSPFYFQFRFADNFHRPRLLRSTIAGYG